MADKARHAFGNVEQVDTALSNGIIDAFDILFLKDENGKPYVGWIDKAGNKVIVDDSQEFERIETELLTKITAEDVEEMIVGKVDSTEVDTRISQAMIDTAADAKAYTDDKIQAAVAEHVLKKYDVEDSPEGTLVKYGKEEIRIMCPANAVYSKQSVGVGGDPNTYYVTFKTYAPSEAAVGYIEHLGDQVDSEILTTFNIDKDGRRYQPTWLGVAKYNETTEEWEYYGKNSSANKYIGWNYQIDWFDANGVMIASDSIRINLSNEDCHSYVKPYYIGEMDAKIAEASGIEVIEF